MTSASWWDTRPWLFGTTNGGFRVPVPIHPTLGSPARCPVVQVGPIELCLGSVAGLHGASSLENELTAEVQS